LGQKSGSLSIYNLISRNSIEQHIAAGLLVKQSLFEGALSKGGVNYVDFSTKGRSQFVQQLEELINQQEHPETPPEAKEAAGDKSEELTEVLNNGMRFLSSLFKMSTGKDFNFSGQKIEIDKKTGEIVLRFKTI
jgi:hypothetical protein